MCAIIRTIIVDCSASIYRDRVSFFLPFCSSGLMLYNHPSFGIVAGELRCRFRETGPAGSRCFLQRRARWRTEEKHRGELHPWRTASTRCSSSVSRYPSVRLSRFDYPTMSPSLRAKKKRYDARGDPRETAFSLKIYRASNRCVYLRPTEKYQSRDSHAACITRRLGSSYSMRGDFTRISGVLPCKFADAR